MITSAVVLIATKDNRHFEIPCHRHAFACGQVKELEGLLYPEDLW